MGIDTKSCPECYAPIAPAMLRCRECGYVLPKDEKSEKAVPNSNSRIMKAPDLNAGALSLDDMLSMAEDVEDSPQLDDFVIAQSSGNSTPKNAAMDVDLSDLEMSSSIQSSPLVKSPHATPPSNAPPTNNDTSGPTASGPYTGDQGTNHTENPSEQSGRIRRRSSGIHSQPSPAQNDSSNGSSGTRKRRRTRGDSKNEISQNAAFRKAVMAALKLSKPKIEKEESKDQKKLVKRIPKLQSQLEKHVGDDKKLAIDATRDLLDEIGQSQHEDAIPVLAEFLKDKRPSISEFAAKSLGKTRIPESLQPLLYRLSEVPVDHSAPYISAIGELGDRRAIHPLVVYGNENPQMSRRTIDAIVSIGKAGVPGLIELAESDDPAKVLAAVNALGQIKDKRALDVVAHVLKSEIATLRCHAAESLGVMADPKAVKPLIAALNDKDSNVRANVTAALAKLPDERCVAPLVKALRDSDTQVQIFAAQALGDCGDAKAAAPLMKLLDQNDPNLLMAACESLGKLGDKKAVPRICEFLVLPEPGDDTSIIIKALETLRRLRSPAAVAPLLEMLPATEPIIRQRTIEALGQTKDKSVAETLEHVLSEDKSEDVRAAAAKALGELGDPESVPALEESLQDTFNIRVKAVIALGAIKHESAVPTLTSLLRDQLPEIRYHAASSLAEIGHQKSSHQIEPLAADESTMVSRGALKALKKLGDERSEKEIVKAAKKRVGSTKSAPTASFHFDPREFLPESLLQILWPDDAKTRIIAAVSMLVVLCLTGFGALWLFTEPSISIPRAKVACLAFSPDGKMIAAGRTRGLLEIWHADPAKNEWPYDQIPINLGNITSVAFVSDNTILASLNNDLYVIEDGSPRLLTSFPVRLADVTLTADRKKAAIFDDDGGVAIYDTQSLQGVGAIGLPKGVITSRGVGPTGELVIGGQADGKVSVFDLTGKEVKTFQTGKGAVTAVAFSTDKKSVYAGKAGGETHIFDFETGERVYAGAPKLNGTGNVTAFGVPQSGKELIVSCRRVVSLNLESNEFSELPGTSVINFGVSSDGKWLALSIDEETYIELIELGAKKSVAKLDIPLE